MSRKVAREYAYQLIFEYLFTLQPNTKTLGIFSSTDVDAEDIHYIERVYYGVIGNFEEIKAIIIEFAHGFSFERIYKTDLAALFTAIYEMKYMDDIPNSVSINEAVELVKRYSTEKSNVFVNGILSSVYKTLNIKADGTI